jgi:hypothetical protein
MIEQGLRQLESIGQPFKLVAVTDADHAVLIWPQWIDGVVYESKDQYEAAKETK